MPDPDEPLPRSYRLLHLDEVASTNAEALRLGQDGEPAGLWVLADRQTGGRGRSGRSWISLPGNLHASLLLRPQCTVADAVGLALLAGVAAVDAIEDAAMLSAGATVRLKWPNDILIADAKAGGILVESSASGREDAIVAVVGIGLNLVSHPGDINRPVTHLGAHGSPPNPLRMLRVLTEAMDKWLRRWNDGAGFETVRQAWLCRAGPIGERLAVHTGREVVVGGFAGLDQGGALLLTDDAGREWRFGWGDVDLLDSA